MAKPRDSWAPQGAIRSFATLSFGTVAPSPQPVSLGSQEMFSSATLRARIASNNSQEGCAYSRSQKECRMGDFALRFDRRQFHRVLLHVGGFLLVFLAAYWLRGLTLSPDPILQGYLQITTGLFAFVFAAVTLVRFQGTQDRISLILGSGFLLSGATLTASSVLFFQGMRESTLWFVWAPAAWWISRLLLALLFVAALVVEHFLPRSRHPRLEIA